MLHLFPCLCSQHSWRFFGVSFYFVVCKVRVTAAWTRLNRVRNRKRWGRGRRERIITRKALIKKTLNDRKQENFGATFGRLTSDLKTCHIILSQKLEEVFQKSQGVEYRRFFLFTSPLASFPIISFLSLVQLLARMNLLLYQPLKRKKKQTKNRQLRISRAPQTFQYSLPFFFGSTRRK